MIIEHESRVQDLAGWQSSLIGGLFPPPGLALEVRWQGPEKLPGGDNTRVGVFELRWVDVSVNRSPERTKDRRHFSQTYPVLRTDLEGLTPDEMTAFFAERIEDATIGLNRQYRRATERPTA